MHFVDDVKGAVVDQPPANGPGQAHAVIGEQRDAEPLGVLQEEGRDETAPKGAEQAHLQPRQEKPHQALLASTIEKIYISLAARTSTLDPEL